MNNTIFSILPCYNEELNISDLIDEWNLQKTLLEHNNYSLTICAIDDCSKDNTKAKIEEKAMTSDSVILLEHPINKGLCGGLNTGLTYFLKHAKDGDLMALMDGDNTHNPKYIHEMISKIQLGADCVIASRYCNNSNVVGVAAHREFLSDMAKVYYRAVLQVPNVQDYTCGYRLYTYPIISKLIDKFGKDPIKEKSFACMMELLYKLYLAGASFDEVGFELRYDNKKGASKMQVLNTMTKSITTALSLKKLH